MAGRGLGGATAGPGGETPGNGAGPGGHPHRYGARPKGGPHGGGPGAADPKPGPAADPQAEHHRPGWSRLPCAGAVGPGDVPWRAGAVALGC